MISIHATCVVIGAAGEAFGIPTDAGVLLMGDSGSGKSDLALRLIAGGAILVADDRCDLFVAESDLRARAPQPLRGLLEVRGIGIVPVPFREEAGVRLVARLVLPAFVTRFSAPARYRPAAELALPERDWPPEIEVAPFEASAAAKIVAALAAGIEHIGERSCE